MLQSRSTHLIRLSRASRSNEAARPLSRHQQLAAERSHKVTIILPTYNEKGSIAAIIKRLLPLKSQFELEIIVVDDDSADGTADVVRCLARGEPRLRLVRRVGRGGLASAIKEGLLNATGDLAVVMDSDGQHEPSSVLQAIRALQRGNLDLVIGSRFHPAARIHGLSAQRETGSCWANAAARLSLPRRYRSLTDYMSGFFVLQLEPMVPLIRVVEVNGFKFLYELLAISKGQLSTAEVPLTFQPRSSGRSKLDLAIFWDFLISILHNSCFRLVPRRAISFGLVGLSGVGVQLAVSALLMVDRLAFGQALPIAVVIAASSNYLINNALTFRFRRLQRMQLLKGLLKFLIVASLPVMANVGLASAFYYYLFHNPIWAQLAGIMVVFIWNYAASSKFVWNTP